jgi:hypothetical protein
LRLPSEQEIQNKMHEIQCTKLEHAWCSMFIGKKKVDEEAKANEGLLHMP